MFEQEVTNLGRPLSLDRTAEFWLIVLFFSNDHPGWVSRRYIVFEKMDAVPADLQPPQLIYIMLMCLRALAVQAGVFVSPADMSWEQANPNGANGPVGCTIGDGSNLGSALEFQTAIQNQKRRNLKVLVEKHKYLRRMMAHGSRRSHLLVEGGNALPAQTMTTRGRRRARSNDVQISEVSKFHCFFLKKKKNSTSMEVLNCDTMETLTMP